MRPEGAEAERLVPVQLRRALQARAGYRKPAALVLTLSAGKAGQAGPGIVAFAQNGAAAAGTGTTQPAKTLFLGLFQFGAVEGVDPAEAKGLLKAIREPLVAAPAH